MNPRKSSKPTKKDKAWQQEIEKRVQVEKVELDHLQGKERFESVVRRAKKKSNCETQRNT